MQRTDERNQTDEKQNKAETLDAWLGVWTGRGHHRGAQQFGVLSGERNLIGRVRDLLGERGDAFELEIALEVVFVEQKNETEHSVRVAYETGGVHLGEHENVWLVSVKVWLASISIRLVSG